MSSSDLHDLLASGQAPLLMRPPTHGTHSGRINALGDGSNENSGGNDTKSSSVSTFQSLIKKWEEQKSSNSYDPTDCLNEMADILEKVRFLLFMGFLLKSIKFTPNFFSFYLYLGARCLFI